MSDFSGETRLAYCPFCGNKHLEYFEGFSGISSACCRKCGAKVFFLGVHDYESFAKKWNRRCKK